MSINYYPEVTGISVYSTGMAEFMARAGHEVTVYTAFPYYPAWEKLGADLGRVFANEIIKGVRLRRSYIYVPTKPTAIRRILHEFSFSCSAAISFILGPTTDVTIVVTPPLLLSSLFGVLGKLKKTKIVVHVQDLQPDAAIDLGMLRPGILTTMLYRLERWGYALATRISTISDAMREKIESKGVPPSKTLLFKNWANDDFIKPLQRNESLRNELCLDGSFIVLYSGNMGVKQGLGMLLDAAFDLLEETEILFLIVGDGGEKDFLVAQAQARGLSNVRFMAPVARESLNRLLACADVSVITQKAGIDDLVLPSKLGNLLFSQRAVIVSTSDRSELASIVDRAACGIVIPPEDGMALARGIRRLIYDEEERTVMANNAHKYAVANLRSEVILRQFESQLLDIVGRK